MGLFRRETTEIEQVDELEGHIRELVRHDVAGVERQPGNDGEQVASNLSSLLQRVSVNLVHEIDRLIGELGMLRDHLQKEAERVGRAVIEYGNLNQLTIHSTKIISENLNHSRQGPDPPPTAA